MAKAHAGKEIHAVTENKVGTLADITQWLADKGINIRALCAYVDNGKAHFHFTTTENKKAVDILRARSLATAEEEVVAVEIQNKVGSLKDIVKKIRGAEVDINHLYTTTSETPNATCTVVLRADDNAKVIKAING